MLLWNTRTRKKEEFVSIKPNTVGFYACGPTVYGRAHIGNLRAYIMEDVLRRTLERNGYEVNHVMNITDVGHLTDDADAGEDKLEKTARSSGRNAREIADEFTRLFFDDSTVLNIKRPHHTPKATDHIDSQIALIQVLEKKGYTYQTSDGVYFDTSKWKPYGSFSGQLLEEKEEGARVVVNAEKKHPTDFALWKLSRPDEKRQMEWASPWGVGFPGWHIECSAMSHDALGQPFDIHAGGVDHIPVHHENEIAQSESAFGSRLANYWMHVEFLNVDGQKMSKSLGNTHTVQDMLDKEIDPVAFRYFCLGAHYRQKQNFTWDALRGALTALGRLRGVVRDWDTASGGVPELEHEFYSALDDDLNTAKALAVVWKLVDSSAKSAHKSATLLNMDEILGLDLARFINKPIVVPEHILILVREREQARQSKNWTKADEIRRELETLGWAVDDTPSGSKARKL